MAQFIDYTHLSTSALIEGFNEAIKSDRAQRLDYMAIWPYFNSIQQNQGFRLALFEQYPFMKSEYETQVIGRNKFFEHNSWTPETSFIQTILMILYH